MTELQMSRAGVSETREGFGKGTERCKNPASFLRAYARTAQMTSSPSFEVHPSRFHLARAAGFAVPHQPPVTSYISSLAFH